MAVTATTTKILLPYNNVPQEYQMRYPIAKLLLKASATGDASGGGVDGTWTLGDYDRWYVLSQIDGGAAGTTGDFQLVLIEDDWEDFSARACIWSADVLSVSQGNSLMGRDRLNRPIDLGRVAAGTDGNIKFAFQTNTDTLVYTVRLILYVYARPPLLLP